MRIGFLADSSFEEKKQRRMSGDNPSNIDIASLFEFHKVERVFVMVIQIVGSKW